MPGGVVFGGAGWMPGEIVRGEGAGIGVSGMKHEQVARAPATREELVAVLEAMTLGRTSAAVPGLVEQMKDLEHRRCRALVVNLLPTQPEYALGAGLTALAIEDLRAGLGAIQRALKADRVIAVLDKHDWGTLKVWRMGAKGHRPGHEGTAYEVRGLVNRYPQGHVTPLMRTVFGRRLQVGHLPTGQGRMVVDPVTLWAFGRWVRAGEKFTHRPVQVFFDKASAAQGAGDGRLVLARIGRGIGDLLQELGITTEGRQVVINGMLSGVEADSGDEGLGAVLADTEAVEVRAAPVCEMPVPCVSCGWCVDVCPTSLMPIRLMELADEAQRFVTSAPIGISTGSLPVTGDPLRTKAAREAIHCIGCGLCSYVCPSRLPLMRQTLRLRGWVLAEG